MNLTQRVDKEKLVFRANTLPFTLPVSPSKG